MSVVAAQAPRSVFLPATHLRRSIAVARAACDGTFTAAGATVHVGWPPRWRADDFHPDREWWIEWIKFYYGLDLAHAFADTGELRYAVAWQHLVQSWIDTVPPSFGPTDATGRRLQNWIGAWTAFVDAPAFAGFAASFIERLMGSIAAQADFLQAHLTPERNHRTLELYALLVVALALPESDPRSARLEFAWNGLQENLLADVRPDGVHREQSTHYHMVALRSFLGARENARRFGLPVRPAFDDRLARAVDFAMAMQRPDGTIPALSDSDRGDYRDCLELAARLLNRDDVRFVATDGREGHEPSAVPAEFPNGGYVFQSTSWKQRRAPLEQQRHLVFDCGPLGDGGHGHYDVLSIDAWAGRPLLVDPGRYTYAPGTPDWRRWFKGTSAHNTVTIDGRDQTAYRTGKPKTAIAAGRRTTLVASPRLDVAGGEARSAEYDAIHERHVFFVNRDYWVIVDELSAESAHVYDLRYHLSAEAWGKVRTDARGLYACGLTLLFDGPGALTLQDGWVSTTYGAKQPAPVASLCAAGQQYARFVTAVLPCRDTGAPCRFSVDRLADGTLTVTLDWSAVGDGYVDRIVWRRGGAAVAIRDAVLQAEAAWTRSDVQGRVVMGSAAGVYQPGDTRPSPIWMTDGGGAGLRFGRGRTS